MWQLLKLTLAIALFFGFILVTILSLVELLTLSYARLFTPLEAEELTVWAEVPEKTFDQKDYHIQYAENEHKLQKAGLKELYR